MTPNFRFRLMSALATFFTAVIAPSLAMAQRGYNPGGGSFACCGSAVIAVPVAIIILNIALLIWVAKDARARGMDNSVLWMLLVLFTSFVGLIIYLFARPKGDFARCPRCRGKKLSVLIKCPHCGAAV